MMWSSRNYGLDEIVKKMRSKKLLIFFDCALTNNDMLDEFMTDKGTIYMKKVVWSSLPIKITSSNKFWCCSSRNSHQTMPNLI